MPHFSIKSHQKLNTCHPALREVFLEVIKHIDCTVISGHRGQKEQDKLKEKGRSQLSFPQSRHNEKPSEAIDVAPYPSMFTDDRMFYVLGGFVMCVASQLGLKIKWGANWRMDWDLENNKFDDLGHFELTE